LEIRDLCCSSKVILVIKLSKDEGGGGSGTHGKEIEMHAELLRRNFRERNYWEFLGVGGKLMFQRVFKK